MKAGDRKKIDLKEYEILQTLGTGIKLTKFLRIFWEG
jgi:hypothetical protein